MIVNAWTVLYLLLSFVSALMGLGAAVVGIPVALGWLRTRPGSEKRDDLERKACLVGSLLVLGLGLRLVMVPIWFATLGSLVPSVPGAMCLTGVHMASPILAFSATVLQFFVPGGYAAWLLAAGIDRRDRLQPCAAGRFRFLPLVVFLLLVTTGLEAATILSIKARAVSCCTSLFDRPHEAVPDIVETSTWLWTVLLVLVTGAGLLLLSLRNRYRLARRLMVLLAPAGILLLLLSLHTRLAPEILGTPFHHCIFCLWRDSWLALLASASTVAGWWLAGSLGLLPRSLGAEASAFEVRAAGWAAGLLIGGFVLLGGMLGVVSLFS